MKVVDTALVIDSDFLMRGYVTESLQRAGIAALVADSADDAKRKLAYQQFDLIFCDIRLFNPRMLRQKRADGRPSGEALCIAMTPFSKVEQAVSMKEKGIYDILIKPFSAEQVAFAVDRARETLELRGKVELLEGELSQPTITSGSPAAAASPMEPEIDYIALETTNLQELERRVILKVLEQTGGNRKTMALQLGISVRTLRNKLNQYRAEEALSIT